MQLKKKLKQLQELLMHTILFLSFQMGIKLK